MNSDLFNKLQPHLIEVVEKPDEGVFTTQEYADHKKLMLRQAQRELAVLAKRGVIERVKTRQRTDAGYVRNQFAWKFVEKQAETDAGPGA